MIKHITNYNESLLPKEHKRIIVEALKDKYAPQAKILDSTLGKIVRLK